MTARGERARRFRLYEGRGDFRFPSFRGSVSDRGIPRSGATQWDLVRVGVLVEPLGGFFACLRRL